MRFPRVRFRHILVFFLAVFSTVIYIFDYQHNHILRHYYKRSDDIVILSATFYKSSRSFPSNTLVVLLNAHQLLHYKRPTIELIVFGDPECRSTNGSFDHEFVHHLSLRPVVDKVPFYCQWTPFLAIGSIRGDVKRIVIAGDAGSKEIPIRMPFAEKLDTVVCITPLFLHDQWQTLLISLATYTHFGSHIHLYLRSLISAEFSLLSGFPRLRHSPWPPLPLLEDFDPNRELEFRNQASAMTDCLLLYKESASFIFFPDLDDLLLPRFSSSLHGEFQNAFQLFPTAAAIIYNMSQSRVHIGKAGTNVMTFSAEKTYAFVEMLGQNRWGKVVVQPHLVNSVWIHQSYDIAPGFEQMAFPIHANSIVHLRYWNKDSLKEDHSYGVFDPLGTGQKCALIKASHVKGIDRILRSVRMKPLLKAMPAQNLYSPIIDKCYDDIFYNGAQHSKCKGPEFCVIPRLNISCVNTIAEFARLKKSDQQGSMNVVIMTSSKYTRSETGCTL